MAERFEKLYSLPNNLYCAGAPVIIVAGSLLKDTQSNRIVAQLKFQSIAPKRIKAIKLSLSAFDVSGKEIQGVSDYQYLDLSISNGQEFGSNKAIVLPNAITRTFSVREMAVVFADGSLWECSATFEVLPDLQSLQRLFMNEEMEKQYRLATSNTAKYQPI